MRLSLGVKFADILTDQINVFVFGLLAPFVLPIINQVKTELNTGSSEIIQSSKEKQLIVFHDDSSSDPTHSMLSKDHFSNILNEPAGKVASQVLKWVVPQLIACWDDERIDIDRTITRITQGVFHHPSLRDFGQDGAVDGRRAMFAVVEQWWGSKDEEERQMMRDQLSRNGVQEGRNHKPGVFDKGHGCGKPLGMPTTKTAQSSGAIGGLAGAGVLGEISSALAGESKYDAGYTGESRPSGGSSSIGKFAEEAVGGGAIGGLVGGLVGGVGSDLLGDAFGGSKANKQSYEKHGYSGDGSYTQSVTETGYSQPQYGSEQRRYGQAEYSQTSYSSGGQRQEYQRYQQDDQSGTSGYGAYGEQVVRDTRPTYGGGYEQTTETRFEGPAGGWQSEVRHEGRDASGEYYGQTEHYEGHHKKSGSDSDSDSDSSKKRKKKEKKHKKHGSNSGSEGGYGRSSEYAAGGYGSSGYGEQRQEYGGGYGRNEGYSENRYEESRYEHGSGGYGGGYGGGGGGYGGEQQQQYQSGGYGGGGGGYAQEPPREERRHGGMGALGGAALGLGAGAIGGAVLTHELEENTDYENDRGYQRGGYGGGGDGGYGGRDDDDNGYGGGGDGGYGGDNGYGGGNEGYSGGNEGYGDDY